MSRYAIKFPFRVRIHGGEFDESARAIHREDGLKTIQAESGIVLESTIERKQMSTKTTFKRIALVTVAALGFGVLATAPSNAAIATAGNAPLNLAATLSASTTTVTLGDEAKTTLTTSGYFSIGDTVTTTVTLKSFPTTALTADVTSALSSLAFTAVDTGVANTATTSTGKGDQEVSNSTGVAGASVDVGAWGTAAGLNSTRTTLSVTPTAVGTYVYNVKTVDTSSATGTTQTWTVVVTAQALTSSTAYIGAVTGTLTADAASTALTASSTIAAAAVARIQTKQYRDAVPTLIDDLSAKSVVVAISGAGALATTNGGAVRGPSVSILKEVEAENDFFIHADGRSGKATITVTIDGVLVATKTFTFIGALASYSVVEEKKNIGVGETGTLTVTGKDANTNDATLGTVTAVSSDVLIATAAVVGGVVTVTGVKAGTATITLMNATTAAAATITKVVTVTILPVTAPTIAWKFDKDSYDAGEKMTLTVTATGVADGARAAFTAIPVANFTLASGSTALVASPVFAAGVATYTLYAPATPGKFTLTASIGQAIDTEIALKKAADTADAAATPVPTTASYVASKATLSATITNPALTAAQEATDAANEATDAGNNAKDAADQAIEAADAATIAAQDAAAAAEAAGEMAVEAAEAAGAIAQDALDAANAATDAALSAAEAADAATAAATEAKESADAATAAVAELSAEVAKLMAALTAKVTTLSTLVAKIAKKVKA
jgi:hypothetical protein